MRIFVLPSWCPTPDQPLSGHFFVEQARALATLRPNWTIALLQFDLARSMVPWRPRHWPGFVRDLLFRQRMRVKTDNDNGLIRYDAWRPCVPALRGYGRFDRAAAALARQARPALADFRARFGQPDLIHAQAGYPSGAAAATLGGETGVPFVITEHLGPFPPPALTLSNGRAHRVIAQAYARAAAHSAVGSALADRIRAFGLAEHVDVIPNFLPDEFGAGLAAPPAAPPFRFLSVGGPSREKGTDTLLRAFAKLDPGTALSIAGPERRIGDFRKLADNLGIGRRVDWLGSVARDAMPGLFARHNAFVLPSRAETFGVVFVEALACGRPVIGTACGGPEDIITGKNGYLVPVDDVTALAEAMKRMIELPEKFQPETLRADFLDRFAASVACDRLEGWFRRVLGN